MKEIISYGNINKSSVYDVEKSLKNLLLLEDLLIQF
jgi:hypothetical protein